MVVNYREMPITSFEFNSTAKSTSNTILSWATFSSTGTTYLDSIPISLVGTNQTVVGSVIIDNMYTTTFNYIVEVTSPRPVISTAVSNKVYPTGANPVTYNVNEYFVDPEGGPITYQTPTLANGSALPSWITFDGYGFFFDVSIERYAEIRLTAQDAQGQTNFQTFTVTVTNQAPVVISPLGTYQLYENRTYTYSLNLGIVFRDPESQPLSFSIISYPSFVVPSIARSTLNLSSSPMYSDIGAHSMVVMASDGSKNVSDTLTLNVEENYPPLVPVLSNINANEGMAGSHTIDEFTDPEGDPITYDVKFANGSALDPTWITFNPGTRTLNFTPPVGLPSVVYLEIFASDLYNAPVSTQAEFRVNRAPKVNTTITELSFSMISQKTSNFTVPGNLFYDEDPVLSYSLINVATSTPPSWLSFSPPQSTVSGNFELEGFYPTYGEADLEFLLIAEDSAGLTQSVSIFVKIFLSCHSTCQTCSGTQLDQCLSCYPGKYFYFGS